MRIICSYKQNHQNLITFVIKVLQRHLLLKWLNRRFFGIFVLNFFFQFTWYVFIVSFFRMLKMLLPKYSRRLTKELAWGPLLISQKRLLSWNMWAKCSMRANSTSVPRSIQKWVYTLFQKISHPMLWFTKQDCVFMKTGRLIREWYAGTVEGQKIGPVVGSNAVGIICPLWLK